MSLHMRSDLRSNSAGRSSYEVTDLPRPQSAHTDNDGRHPRLEEDSHSPQAIVNTYTRLKQRIKNFDDELDKFLAECRQLGRSHALILAAHDLRDRLECLSIMFHENATHLAPYLLERRTSLDIKEPFHWLTVLAQACDTFRERLNEFRECEEETAKVRGLMLMFSEELMYRAFCLKDYRNGELKSEIRQYINDLGDEMGKVLDNLVSAFTSFNQYGMPAMQYEERRATEVLLNMSTVSTFFSGVTATTLQTSLSIQVNDDSNPLIFIVNTFWFCSLVLSIGSALNSLLAVVWKRTTYGSRGHRLPVHMTMWIHLSAPIFLAISIASFSAGFVLFAYSSGQKSHTKFVTLITTAITSFGLLRIAVWLGYEQYIAPRLLSDASWRPFGKCIRGRRPSMAERSRHLILLGQRSRRDSSDCSIGSTRSNSSNFISHILSPWSPVSEISNNGLLRDTDPLGMDRSGDPEDRIARPPATDDVHGQAPIRLQRSVNLISNLKTFSRALKGRLQNAAISSVPAAATPIHSAPLDDKVQVKSPFLLSIPDQPFLTIPLAEVIKDIEYSPNGKYLATTCDDKKVNASRTQIYTTENYQNQSSYIHTSSRHQVSKHISWSPDSETLLIRLSHSVEFLNKDCQFIYAVKRQGKVRSATWISPSEFLLVERSTAFIMSIQGNAQFKHPFPSLLLRDIAVVPNSDLLLVTGHVMRLRDEMMRKDTRTEKQIFLYNKQTREITSRRHLLDDVCSLQISRNITKARDTFDILVGRRSGDSQHSRLWTLRQTGEQHKLSPATIDLQPVAELSGRQHFIGESGQMIAGVYRDGVVHIWDRETGRSICHIQGRSTEKRFRCLAWSTAAATFASIDDAEGKLNIWSIVYRDERQDDLPEIQVQTELETPEIGPMATTVDTHEPSSPVNM